MDISLIVPCYNEGPYLEDNLQALYNLLSFLKMDFEMIIIDDKSINDTFARARNFAEGKGNAQLLSHGVNRGRGYTVTEGIKNAKGKIVGFIDIDLEIASHNIIPLILKVLEGYDVTVGKRIYKMKGDLRWFLSKGYVYLVKFVCKTPFDDTETGLKFFNREKILPILDEIEDPHWFWDTEILARAYYHGLKTAEVPVLYVRGSPSYTTVKFSSDTFYYFKKLLRFSNVANQYKRQRG
jgi:glycosyltransferase involved in cell wall biosynthesis